MTGLGTLYFCCCKEVYKVSTYWGDKVTQILYMCWMPGINTPWLKSILYSLCGAMALSCSLTRKIFDTLYCLNHQSLEAKIYWSFNPFLVQKGFWFTSIYWFRRYGNVKLGIIKWVTFVWLFIFCYHPLECVLTMIEWKFRVYVNTTFL